MKEKKLKLRMPHVLTLIFFLILVVAVMTWIVPSGEFERTIMQTSTGERSVAVAGTYHTVDKVLEDGTSLRQGIWQVLMAPGRGIQSIIEVLAFVFIIGGVFQIMTRTNALTIGIQKIVKKLGSKEILIIPILMALFGLGGSTFGMSDELVPFYLLIMPIMFAMGYDSMTTFMTVCLAATVGYAASTINPFSVLIAQGVAGIQGNPQLIFRMVQWVIMMAIFVCGMVVVVVGLVKSGWYMNELSACFFGMGILMGIAGGLNEKEIAEEFLNGVKDIAFAAMVIGFCSGIMVVAQEGMIIDTILNALSGLVANSNNVMFAGVLYAVQSLLTLLVPSSSGLAALSIPVMAPLCDLHGVNPEAAVTALQYANQLTNLMSPVAGTTVAGLAICRISFGQWWKTIWKVFLLMTVLAIIFCTISAGM